MSPWMQTASAPDERQRGTSLRPVLGKWSNSKSDTPFGCWPLYFIATACATDAPGPAQEQNVTRPKRFYVYAIHVDGVLRYIGKGCNGRMYAHMKEVRQRLTREFNLQNVWPVFQRKLTEAVMQDAVVEEIVLADNLTSKQAYRFEYRRLEEMVYAGKRQQLWNVIPHTINTPEERDAYVSKLTQNLTSKDRWVRYLSRNQLMRLGKYDYGRHEARAPVALSNSPDPGISAKEVRTSSSIHTLQSA
jgi:hypothetical protein